MYARAYAPRRFPPPCRVEELEACFAVRDASGQKLGVTAVNPNQLLATHPRRFPRTPALNQE